MALAQTGFHTRNVADITSVEEQKLSTQVFPVIREIVDFGLYKDGDGAFQYHANVDRVHRSLDSVNLGSTEGIRDEKLRLGVQLISEWHFAFSPVKSQSLSEVKADGLKRMSMTLNALRDAGYDKMPLAKDACGRRIGDGSALLPR